jgi:hypothetical protein
MRVVPPPLSVTLLPPSMTSFVPLSLNTFAVDVSTTVAGLGPQSNVMMPPFATAATTASPVQLAGVPVPTTVVGTETSSAWPSFGTTAWPSGLPAGGPSCTAAGGVTGDGVPPDVDGPPEVDGSPPLVPPLDPGGAVVPPSELLHAAAVASARNANSAAVEQEGIFERYRGPSAHGNAPRMTSGRFFFTPSVISALRWRSPAR